MTNSIAYSDLRSGLEGSTPPLLVDVRRRPAFESAAPGLLAVSLGLSRLFPDDHEMLAHGMVVYDALYAWCKEGQDEAHTWNPAAYR